MKKLNSTTPFPTLSDNALEILKSRYLQRDANGNIVETPDELFRRVAKAVAKAELNYRTNVEAAYWETVFYNLMSALDFLPNSPTLMNAGRPNGQLSACFVLPIEDSLDEIFTTLKEAALIHQSGGGTGFNFSSLRPKGDVVRKTGGTSSGAVSFMKIFDAATEHIRQGGRRRGANMGILNIDHPDIEEFIASKSDKKSLRNFNISVNVTDEFMRTLAIQGEWQLVNPRTGKTVKKINSRQLWDNIVEQAWQTGDPGLIFSDIINRHNPTPALGKLNCTNPCGEMPLLDYESCNLGSINLSNMVKTENGKMILDWAKLEQTIEVALRFLDNVIDVNHYTLNIIKEKTLQTRKIGLGVMGWAELLILLEIPYASETAVQLGSRLMQFVSEKSRHVSTTLAKERDAFPAWRQSVFFPDEPLRNATRTSIAPTGTISIIANTSSSIEPLFALAYKRIGILENKTQMEVNSIFLDKIKSLNLWEEALAEEIYRCGSLENISFIPTELKELFATSLEIPWQYHIRHQIAFQEHTDNAVSKTINLATDATLSEVSNAFQTAWQSGAKGITIYRYGSKSGQVLQKGQKLGKPC